jgi:PAS domain S-box-containing protein
MNNKNTSEKLIDRISSLERSVNLRRQHEKEALQESEERYRGLFSNNHAAMLLIDPETSRIVDANPAACRFYGYGERQLKSMRMIDVNTLSEEEVFRDMVCANMEKRNHFNLRHRLANGEIRDVEVYSGPIKLNSRNLLYSIIHDISQRKAAEKALQHSNETLRHILAASPIGIGMVENGAIRWVNDAMTILFGCKSPRVFIGENMRALYSTEKGFQQAARDINHQLLKSGAADINATFKTKDGATFTGRIKVSASNPEDPFRRAIFTVSDESIHILAENEKLRSEKLQGILELAGAICHELNQPLMAISGYSELASMHLSGDHIARKKLSRILEQVDRMGSILRKLMNITRYKTKNYSSGQKIIDLERAAVAR